MQLSELLAHRLLARYQLPSGTDSEINGISCDSRKIKEGYIFVAIKGFETDGNRFIEQVIEQKAALIITQDQNRYQQFSAKTNMLLVDNDRLAYSLFAAAFYPALPDHLIAVTGTNGKTSVVNFCKQLWNGLEKEAVSIGTLGVVHNATNLSKGQSIILTTPDAENLHAQLQEFAENKVHHIALEASSQGLDQERLSGLQFQAAGFTSFSQDHLDYHHNFENYLNAKMKLFEQLMASDGVAVLNADMEAYPMIKERCNKAGLTTVSYGYAGEQLTIRNITPNPHGQLITFLCKQVQYKISLPLVGEFQVYNILCAIGLLQAVGENIDRIIGLLPNLKSAPGRMEKIGLHPKKAGIYVDYSHTPDALKQALQSLRSHTTNQLYVLFGCGGDRDNAKRPLMGEVAAHYADHVIVTDDNPRTEDPKHIRNQILQACPEATAIDGRRNAIEYAVAQLQEGDILLIAGKGHEDYQIIGDKKISFDDRLIAYESVEKLAESVS